MIEPQQEITSEQVLANLLAVYRISPSEGVRRLIEKMERERDGDS